MILCILILIAVFIERNLRPIVEYVKKDSLLILFYSAKNTRKLILFKL